MIYFKDDFILPDVMDDKLITLYGSITLKNNIVKDIVTSSNFTESHIDLGWKKLNRILCFDQNDTQVNITLNVAYTIMFSPGQIHSIPFKFDQYVKDSPPKSIRYYSFYLNNVLLDLRLLSLIYFQWLILP